LCAKSRRELFEISSGRAKAGEDMTTGEAVGIGIAITFDILFLYGLWKADKKASIDWKKGQDIVVCPYCGQKKCGCGYAS
jgi:hypothetical protein